MAQYYSSSSVVNMTNRDFDRKMNSNPPPVPPKTADSRQRLMELNFDVNNHHRTRRLEDNTINFSPPPPPPPPPTSSTTKQKCNCCPYGFHIDVDFVQYAEDVTSVAAADEAKQIKKAKKRMKRSVEQFAEQQRLRRNLSSNADDSPSTGGRVVSIYENCPVDVVQNTSNESARRSNRSSTKKFETTVDAGVGDLFSPLAMQSSLFSDSLENVMSDFDDALTYSSRSEGGGGRPTLDKDYCSDWEAKKQSKKSSHFNTPALKASAGRNDGYTSDCGYAVPKVTIGSATTTANGMGYKQQQNHHHQHNVGYSSSEYYAAPSILSSSMLSDSMSSLSSVNSSSLHNTTGGSLHGVGVGEAYNNEQHQRRRDDGRQFHSSRQKATTTTETNDEANVKSSKSNGHFVRSSTARDYYESDSGLLSPTAGTGLVKKFTSAKFYEQFNPSHQQPQAPLMTPPPPAPPRPHRTTYTALSGQIAANMENLASVINRIKPPSESSLSNGNGNGARRKTSAGALDVGGLSPGSSSNSSGLQNVREQMAMSMDHMKDLEDQVRSIPVLNVRIKSLKHEKAQLSYELDEAKRQLKDRHVTSATTPIKAFNDKFAALISKQKPATPSKVSPATTPTKHEGEYATALARAMSAVSKNVDTQSSSPPAVPLRTKSIDRMKEVFASPTRFGASSPIIRTPSGNVMNLDEFHSVRRTTPNTSYRSNTGREEDYVSDSELALGDRSTDRFASLRRSRQMLRHNTSTTVPALTAYTPSYPPPPPPRIRFASVGATTGNDDAETNGSWTISKTWSRCTPATQMSSESQRNGHEINSSSILSSMKPNLEIHETKRLKPLVRDVGVNHIGPISRTIGVGDGAVYGNDDEDKNSKLELSNVNAKLFRLNVSTGVNTTDELQCSDCDTRKKRKFSSSSTYTGPLPQPKPCAECDDLRRQLEIATNRPITFSIGTMSTNCMCDICTIRSTKTYRSFDTQTTIVEHQRHVGITVDIPPIIAPCDICSNRNKLKYVDSSTMPFILPKITSETNTDSPEVANRKVNTTVVELRSAETFTDICQHVDASTTHDNNILHKSGYLKEKTTNTDKPVVFTVGFNTDLSTSPSSSAISPGIGVKSDVASNTDVDVDKLFDELIQLRGTQPTCRHCARRANWIDFSDKFTETETIIFHKNNASDADLSSHDVHDRRIVNAACGASSTIPDVVRRSPTKTVGSITDKILGKSVFVSTEKLPTTDRGIDCVAKTRDATTVTQKNRCQSTGTNTSSLSNTGSSPKVSRGSSIDTVNLTECDSCKTNKLTPPRSSKSMDSVGTQSDLILNKITTTINDDDVFCDGQEEVKRRTVSCSEIATLPVELEPKTSETNTTTSSSTATTVYETKNISSSSSVPSTTTTMNESFLYESTESVTSKDDENIVSPLVDDDDFEQNEKLCQEENYFRNEEKDVYFDIEENEYETSLATTSKEKFDFTKPRATRAFALSKAAATKKLLMTDQNQKVASSSSAPSYSSSMDANNFRRNAVQSRSVRVESKNKGDSLAYITDKKHASSNAAGTSASNVVRNGGGGAKIISSNNDTTTPVKKPSVGLKSKVHIKKPLNERKSTGAIQSSLRLPTRITPPALKNSISAPENLTPKELNRKSLLMDDEKEEAADTLGPLPSELARSWSTGAKPSSPVTPSLGYDNPGVSDDLFDSPPQSSRSDDRLVSNIVENLPDIGGDDDESSDSDDSVDEGSYDTNGNITNKCDLPVGQAHQSNQKQLAREDSIKFVMSEPLKNACEVMNRSLIKSSDAGSNERIECAQQFLQHEWLKASARKAASPRYVEEFLDAIEGYSRQLLHKVVNMCDQNENTVLHYAVSHGNFDIVSLLLDTKVCNLNRPNKAGYTPVMLAALCPISNDTDRVVIQRLFQMGDVNIKASQHGQTALMLAVSHGKMETTKLLLEAGAGVNIQDEDGSTALMCAAEHGHKEIVRLLLSHPEIDASMADYDGSTALSIAVDNGHKDIGVLIYAHLNYSRSATSVKSQSTPVWC